MLHKLSLKLADIKNKYHSQLVNNLDEQGKTFLDSRHEKGDFGAKSFDPSYVLHHRAQNSLLDTFKSLCSGLSNSDSERKAALDSFVKKYGKVLLDLEPYKELAGSTALKLPQQGQRSTLLAIHTDYDRVMPQLDKTKMCYTQCRA